MTKTTTQRLRIVVGAGTAVLLICSSGPGAQASDTVIDPQTWKQAARDTDVTIDTSVKTYPVRGVTKTQIETSMASAGPDEIGGKRSIGSHQPASRISYLMRQTPTSCDLYSHDITYTGVTTLPRWTTKKGASPHTRRWWDATLNDITQHEQEHAFLAVIQILALDQMLDGLPAADTCTQIKNNVDAATDDRWKAARASNKSFDRWTHHGTRGPYWIGPEGGDSNE